MIPSDTQPSRPVRLQVYLAKSGICSRRKAMEIIFAGRVTVNGRVAREPSLPVRSGRDSVCVNDEPIREHTQEYILLNKPRNFMTTRLDPHAAQTIYDLLPAHLRSLHPVGRLDKDTEGLLLLTNDGALTHRLTHPKHLVDKTYRVRIHGTLKVSDRRLLEKGLILDGHKTAPAKIDNVHSDRDHTVFEMTLREGRKRQIRRMLKQRGYPVVHLKRLSLGPIHLGHLKSGQYRRLRTKEIEALKNVTRHTPHVTDRTT